MDAALAVFDFDKTLSSIETERRHVGAGKSADVIVDTVFGGAARAAGVKALVAEMRREGAVVKKALDAAGIVVDGLLGDTAGDHDPRWTHYETFEGQKSKVINDELMHEFGVPVFSAARLLFADDSRSNCRDVEKAFPGATVVHVQDDGRVGHGAPISPAGIGDAEADAIRAWLKKIASPS